MEMESSVCLSVCLSLCLSFSIFSMVTMCFEIAKMLTGNRLTGMVKKVTTTVFIKRYSESFSKSMQLKYISFFHCICLTRATKGAYFVASVSQIKHLMCQSRVNCRQLFSLFVLLKSGSHWQMSQPIIFKCLLVILNAQICLNFILRKA